MCRDPLRIMLVDGFHGVPKNTSRHISTTADGDHEVGVEVLQDSVGGLLAQLVHLLGDQLVSQQQRQHAWGIIIPGCR
jgi:hypothetical protein